MSDRDQYKFAEAFEEKTGWDAEDYPNRDVVNLCFSMWQASREALKAEQEGAWIACSERMPEVGEAVLIRISCSNHFNIENGKYKGDGLWLGCWFSTYGEKGSAYQVDHWMPLPAPPSQPHPIDTTSQQYETLAKGGAK